MWIIRSIVTEQTNTHVPLLFLTIIDYLKQCRNSILFLF
jgi:hypothetical protein